LEERSLTNGRDMFFKRKNTVKDYTKIATRVARGSDKILTKEIGMAEHLERCYGMPIIKYSVLKEFTESLLEKSQE
jgi:hypothetical protein